VGEGLRFGGWIARGARDGIRDLRDLKDLKD
jgi:hypothetical protein